MRKKSALILIQWSLGQVKHCVHVTFIQRPIAMRIDGKPLDLRCKWFLFLWECRKSPISDSALLYHRCQLILDSMALIVVLSRGLISWLRGRETKLEFGSSLLCLLQGALWCFFPRQAESPAKHTHIYNSTLSTILIFLKRSWKRGNSFGLCLSSSLFLRHSSKDCFHTFFQKRGNIIAYRS